MKVKHHIVLFLIVGVMAFIFGQRWHKLNLADVQIYVHQLFYSASGILVYFFEKEPVNKNDGLPNDEFSSRSVDDVAELASVPTPVSAETVPELATKAPGNTNPDEAGAVYNEMALYEVGMIRSKEDENIRMKGKILIVFAADLARRNLYFVQFVSMISVRCITVLNSGH